MRRLESGWIASSTKVHDYSASPALRSRIDGALLYQIMPRLELGRRPAWNTLDEGREARRKPSGLKWKGEECSGEEGAMLSIGPRASPARRAKSAVK